MNSLFANNWGLRKGIKEALQLFSSHFITLAILSSFIILLTRIYYMGTGIAIAYLQAGFDLKILNGINIWNPHASLSGDFLYQFLSGIGAAFFSVLNASVFALAYLKYSDAKISVSLFNDF